MEKKSTLNGCQVRFFVLIAKQILKSGLVVRAREYTVVAAGRGVCIVSLRKQRVKVMGVTQILSGVQAVSDTHLSHKTGIMSWAVTLGVLAALVMPGASSAEQLKMEWTGPVAPTKVVAIPSLADRPAAEGAAPSPQSSPSSQLSVSQLAAAQETSLPLYESFDGPYIAPNPPGDCDIAVSEDKILAAANGMFQVHDKESTGVPLATFSEESRLFAQALTLDDGDWSARTKRPQVAYDTAHKRFFAMEYNINRTHAVEPGETNVANCVILAVSDTPDPLGAWHVYRFPTLEGVRVDYPQMTITADAVVVSYRAYQSHSGRSYGTGMAIIPLMPLIRLQPVTANFGAGNGVTSRGELIPFLMPCKEQSPGTLHDLYFINSYNDATARTTGYIGVWRLTNMLSSPLLIGQDVPVQPYIPEPQGGQQYDGTILSGKGNRCHAAFDDGTSLWAAHEIRDEATSCPSVRWYEIKRDPSTSKVIQSGTLLPDSIGDALFMPAIAVGADGGTVISCTRTKQSDPLLGGEFVYATRTPDMPPGTMNPIQLIFHENACSYRSSTWGEYAGACMDPVDASVWTIGEYTAGLTIFRSRVAHIVSNGITVFPLTGMTVSTHDGPKQFTYTLTNTTTQPVTYSVSKTKPWLTLSNGSITGDGPIVGTLLSRKSVQITVSLNSGAEIQPEGIQKDSIVFSGANHKITRPFTLLCNKRKPVAQNQSVNVTEDTPATIMLQGSDMTFDSQLTYTLESLPTHGVLLENGTTVTQVPYPIPFNGSAIVYSPNPDYNSTDEFRYSVSNSELTSDQGAVGIMVQNVNDAPRPVADTLVDRITRPSYYPAFETFVIDAVDPDGDDFKVSVKSMSRGMAVQDIATSPAITYTSSDCPFTLETCAFVMPSARRVPGTIKYTLSDGNTTSPVYEYRIDSGYAVDDIGHPALVMHAPSDGPRMRANLYECTISGWLTNVQALLGIYPTPESPVDLEFFICQASSENGPFTKIYNSTFVFPGNPGDNPTSGTNWYKSDNSSVYLSRGNYYLIGSAWRGNVTYYLSNTARHPEISCIGWTKFGYALDVYPSPMAPPDSLNDHIYMQRLNFSGPYTRPQQGGISKTDEYFYDSKSDAEDSMPAGNDFTIPESADGTSIPMDRVLTYDDRSDYFYTPVKAGNQYVLTTFGCSELYRSRYFANPPTYPQNALPGGDVAGDDLYIRVYDDPRSENLIAYRNDPWGGVEETSDLSFTVQRDGVAYMQMIADDPGSSMTYGLQGKMMLDADGPSITSLWDDWDPMDDGPEMATVLPDSTWAYQAHGPHTLYFDRGDSEDWFVVLLQAGYTYDFNSIGGTGGAIAGTEGIAAEIWDPSMLSTVASNSGSGGNGMFKILYSPPTTDFYFVRVYNYEKYSRYYLNYAIVGSSLDQWDPDDDTPTSAPSLLEPSDVWRVHGPHKLGYSDPTDWFKVYLQAGDEYVFTSASDKCDALAALYSDPKASPIVVNVHGGQNGRDFELRYVPTQSGYFYLKVSVWNLSADPNPSYLLGYVRSRNLLDPWDHTDDTKAGATVINSPTISWQQHGPHRLMTWPDTADWFKVFLAAGVNYEFNSVSGTGDLMCVVYDPTGTKALWGDDDSGGFGQFRILFTPPVSGYYYLQVVPKGAPNSAYMLNYRRTSMGDQWDPGDDTSLGASVLPAPGINVQRHGVHTLSSDDRADWFAVQLQAFISYTFTTVEGTGDNYGELYRDAAGTQLVASDDNSGGGDKQFAITYTPSRSGTYYLKIRAKSLSFPDSSYTLAYGQVKSLWDKPVAMSTGTTPKGADDSPQVACDGKGSWVAVWSSRDTLGGTIGTDSDILVARSSDDGKTWSKAIALNSNAATDSFDDRMPQIATDGKGRWIAVWTGYGTSAAEGDIYYSISADDGTTWTPRATLNTNAATDSGDDSAPSIQVNSKGDWICTWMSSDSLGGTIGTDRDILWSKSTNGGITWSAPAALNTDAMTDTRQDWQPNIACDPTGQWMVVWMAAYTNNLAGEPGLDWDIFFSTSETGTTWTQPQTLNARAAIDQGNDQYPVVTSTGIGQWAVAWQTNNDVINNGVRLHYDVVLSQSSDNGQTWSAPVRTYPDEMDAREDSSPRIAGDSVGDMMLVWQSRDVNTPGGKGETVFAYYEAAKHTWLAPNVLNINSMPGTKEEYSPCVGTDGAGTWLCAWSSTDRANGLAGPDLDILSVVARLGTERMRDTFDIGNLQPAGSTVGWSAFGMQALGLASDAYDTSLSAYVTTVSPNSDAYRKSGFLSNKSEWLPYSSIGTNQYVRAKFYVFSTGQTTSDLNEIPNMRLRLANRFAVSAYLDVLHHDITDVPNNKYRSELRPSSDPTNPSVYRLDFDPIDVPYLQTTAGEGIMRGIEAFCLEPQENGVLGLAESVIGTYGAAAVPQTVDPVKVYAPSGGTAGSLAVFNRATDVQEFNFILPPFEGGYATVDTDPKTEKPVYSEGANGVTFDTTAVQSDMLGIIRTEFYPGSDQSKRVRVEEGKQYKVRFHVVSDRPSTLQAGLVFKSRSVRFSWCNRLELSGAFVTNSPANLALTQQTLPGIGCMNPDKNGSEYGGWYTLLMNSPLDKDIRPEFSPVVPVSSRMPNLSSLPGPGQNATSIRDLRVGAEVWDTLSTGNNQSYEGALVTIDRIEVRAYDAVKD